MVELTKKEKRKLAKEKKARERQKEELQSGLKKALVIALILGAVGFFGYKIYAFFTAPVPEVVQEPVEIVGSDWTKGSQEYEVTLLEYGDFQCPACASYFPMVKQLLEEYPEELRVVYRHFPLPSHKNAYAAALAAEAAGDQGKFWEMHDILFEKQDDWANVFNPKDKFVEYAQGLELDTERFVSFYESDEAKEKVDADMLSGNKLGVNATPTFYLDGDKLESVGSYQELSSKIKEAIGSDDGNSN